MDKLLIGSQYFFSCYDDFHSKDIDQLAFVDTNEFNHMRQVTGQGKCLFQMKRHSSKEAYIEWALKSQLGMVVGKFLVPEFCAAIGFTIEDLPQMKVLIDKLDDKHKYEEIIFNSYMENGNFTLTEAQRDLAYQSYKMTRGV